MSTFFSASFSSIETPTQIMFSAPSMPAPFSTLFVGPSEVVPTQQTEVPVIPQSSEAPITETAPQVEDSVDTEKEVDFLASLLMDFSKGVFSSLVSQDTVGKRKSDEIDATPLLSKKNKRMPRSPSINTLMAEQTIACEEHSSKHVRCPLNCPNRRPGSKRVRMYTAEESRSSAQLEKEDAEYMPQVNAPVQKAEPIQLVFQEDTKTYDLPKPSAPEDFIQIIKWALVQLTNAQGTLEQIFNVIRKNGWKELKFGTLREMLVSKKYFQKYLDEAFEKTLTTQGQKVYYSKDVFADNCNFDTDSDFGMRTPKKKSQPKKVKAAREPQSPSSDISLSPISSPPPATPENSLLDSTSSSLESSGEMNFQFDAPNSDKKKKGRRWLRFACEKHRKEHTKCSENCPHRRITYTIKANGEIADPFEC